MTWQVSSAKILGFYALLQFIMGVMSGSYTSEGQDKMAILEIIW